MAEVVIGPCRVRGAQCAGWRPTNKETPVNWLWIIIIVLIVLALLGYFGRGRLR